MRRALRPEVSGKLSPAAYETLAIVAYQQPVARSRFLRDPEIKAESLWTGLKLQRANVFAERNGPSVRIRDQKGVWRQAIDNLQVYDSMLTHCGDPRDGDRRLAGRGRHSQRAADRREPCGHAPRDGAVGFSGGASHTK